MSLHRVQLEAKKGEGRPLSRETIAKLQSGTVTVAEALQLEDGTIDDLRRQAMTLGQAGRFDDARTIFEGLVALGAVGPLELFGLSACHRGLGDEARADEIGHAAQRLLTAVERELGLEAPAELSS